jgi:hypothetical protein
MIMLVTIITQSGQTIKAGTQVPTRVSNNPLNDGFTVTQVLHEDWWQHYEVTKPMTFAEQLLTHARDLGDTY